MCDFDDKLNILVREFLRYGADCSAIENEASLDYIVGPWETYWLLLQESQPDLSAESKCAELSSRLYHLSRYFVPSERHHYLPEIDAERHLTWEEGHLGSLGAMITSLLSEGADPNGGSERMFDKTPLQQVLFFSAGVEYEIQSSNLLRSTSCGSGSQGLCYACAYHMTMPEPALKEWLLLLGSNGIDLYQYVLRESEKWLAMAQNDVQPCLHQLWGSRELQLVSERVFALRCRILVETGHTEEKIFLHDVGIFRRTVRFDLNMDDQSFEDITFEDAWENDELGRGACFCKDAQGHSRTQVEIEAAENAHQKRLQQFREDRIMAEADGKLSDMPGAWKNSD